MHACWVERASSTQQIGCLRCYDVSQCDAEAETLQQRAERKRGREAVSAYEQAAVSIACV